MKKKKTNKETGMIDTYETTQRNLGLFVVLNLVD